MTELPGLDELSYPRGVLQDLEARAAQIWGVKESIISVGGASTGLMAVMLALAANGKRKFIVPRNAHRSVVHGLILSGHMPVWYEPLWDHDWGLYGGVSGDAVRGVLENCGDATDIAGMLVVSPTYAGAMSDIAAIAAQCRQRGIPLIVDEAHGAHLLPGLPLPQSATGMGADVVVHSLHKTLSGLTQTGLVHLSNDELTLSGSDLRLAVNTLQTSSPSYPLLMSIEDALLQIVTQPGQENMVLVGGLASGLIDGLRLLGSFEVYACAAGNDPYHVLVKSTRASAQDLFSFAAGQGLWPEAQLGAGVLFMLGVGTGRN